MMVPISKQDLHRICYPWGYFILSVKSSSTSIKESTEALDFPLRENLLSGSDSLYKNILEICLQMLLHILAVQNFFSTSIVEVCSRQAALWFPWHGSWWAMQLYTGWVTGGIASGKTLCPASWRLLWHHLNPTDSITTHPRAVLNLTPLDSVHLLASQQILSYPWVRQQDIMSVPNKSAIARVPVFLQNTPPHTQGLNLTPWPWVILSGEWCFHRWL